MKIDKQNGNVDDCGIYCISNSRYFYIGCSIHIRKRWAQHRRRLQNGNHENPFMQRVYDKYKEIDPFEYIIILECEEDNLSHFEVKTFEDFKEKYSDKIAMNINKCGQIDTKEARQKKSNSHTGKVVSEEVRQKISENNKGKHSDPDKYVKVVQLSKTGTLIKVWDSIKKASEETGIKINLNRKSCGGFVWQRYEEYLIQPKVYKLDTTKKVGQYSKDGILLNVYNSIQEAADAVKTKHCNISNTITNKQKTAAGFIWKLIK